MQNITVRFFEWPGGAGLGAFLQKVNYVFKPKTGPVWLFQNGSKGTVTLFLPEDTEEKQRDELIQHLQERTDLEIEN